LFAVDTSSASGSTATNVAFNVADKRYILGYYCAAISLDSLKAYWAMEDTSDSYSTNELTKAG